MVTNLMQLYVLPEAGQVEVLKVKVQKICVLINLIMIFILFYFVFVLNIFYKHCLSSYFLIRYIILITGHYTPTQWILEGYMFVKHTSHGFLFYQLSKQTALQIDTRHQGLTFKHRRNLNSHFLFLYFSRSSMNKLLVYQLNLSCVIMSLD